MNVNHVVWEVPKTRTKHPLPLKTFARKNDVRRTGAATSFGVLSTELGLVSGGVGAGAGSGVFATGGGACTFRLQIMKL